MSGMMKISLRDAAAVCARSPVKYSAIIAIGAITGCRISETERGAGGYGSTGK